MEIGRESVIQKNPLCGGTGDISTHSSEVTEYNHSRLPFRKRLHVSNSPHLSPQSSSSEGNFSPCSSTALNYGLESDHQSDSHPSTLGASVHKDLLNHSSHAQSDGMDRVDSNGSSNSSSASPTSSHGGRNSAKPRKFCEVCGDIAKSLHFGGLSCDSCKAFFRRSVHNDAYLQFTCGYESSCQINKQTRKACQKCRFLKCMLIGMEMKWVMSEEERKLLNKQRMAKKGQPNFSAQASSPSDGSGTEDPNLNSSSPSKTRKVGVSHSSAHTAAQEYSPNVEEMLNYMSLEEQHNIRDVCELYRISYEKIPYKVSKTTAGIRNSLEVIGMFTTILRRFAYFSKLVPEFEGLNKEDQGNLLKASVLEMVMLRGALSFDIENHRWPNTNLELLANCPQLRVEDMENLVSPELFEMHMKFIRRLQTLKVDEPTSMLLILIVMFCPERSELQDVQKISLAQEKYCTLLKKYVTWRYGPAGTILYPKLLTQLSDLRQLNDLHTEYHLNLAETEVNVIRQDLSQLRLDPYPQWKIVDPNVDGTAEGSPQFPQESVQFSPPSQPQPSPTVPVPSPPGPIRSTNRTHSRMREAFLRRIPQLIEDPFCPLMTQDEMMKMAGAGYGTGFPSMMSTLNTGMYTAPHTAPTSEAFDPWQHRHHTSQQRSSSASKRSQVQDSGNSHLHQFQQYINDPNNANPFELEKLQNIQNIMESLSPETLSKLQSMFFQGANNEAPNNPTSVPSPLGTLGMGAITPGLFANLFTAEMQLQSQVNLADLMKEFENSTQSQQSSPP